MGKRKGDDVLVAGATTTAATTSGNSAASVVTPLSSPLPSWLDSASIDHKLWVVRERCGLTTTTTTSSSSNDDDHVDDVVDNDFFVSQVEQCHATQRSFRQQERDMMQLSAHIQVSLHDQIAAQQEKCQQESSTLSRYQDDVEEMVHQRDDILADMAHLDQQRSKLRQQIATAQLEANQFVESINHVEEARKNQVPRLKHQISLYATTTGIKWDFENDHLLQGHVSIPSKEVVRSFSIDPEEHSRFEIANKLWRVLDTSQEV